MREQILAALSQYGSPVLFGVVTVASIGLPLPISLLLVVTGSLVSQGVMNLWVAIALAGTGSVLGDQIGYAIGRWGGNAVIARFGRLLGGPEKLKSAEAKARRWGGTGVFLTRWLLSPLGPAVNLVSGTAGYPWGRFLLWDVLGEFLGVAIYILLGREFSDHVVELDSILGDLTWTFVALAVAVLLGWKIVAYLRAAK
jgi:membrane protein DedA with SNARE-associated domain